MAPSPGKGPSQVKALVASAGASLSGALSKVVGSSKKCKAAGEAPGHLQSRDGRRALLDCLEALFVGRGVAKAEIGDLLLELGRDFNEDRLGREPGDDGAAAAEEARRTKSKNEMNLPPELVAFTPLREHPLVAAARAEIEDAERALLAGEGDPSRLSRACDALATTVVAAAETMLRDECTLLDASRAAPEFFGDVYKSLWHTVDTSERRGVEAYLRAVALVEARCEAYARSCEGRKVLQREKHVVTLFRQAAAARPAFEASVADAFAESGADHELTFDFKGCARVVEKTALRPDRPGAADHVLDLCRAMAVCKTMDDVAKVVKAVARKLRPVRCKSRFERETSSGWRDCLVNVSVDGHICELQISHRTMIAARRGLHGHDVYSRSRNADEVIAYKYRDKAKALDCQTALEWALWVPRLKPPTFATADDDGRLVAVRMDASTALAAAKTEQFFGNLVVRYLEIWDAYACDALTGSLSPCRGMKALRTLKLVKCPRVRGKLADVAAAAAGTLAHLDASESAGLEGTLEDLRACGKLERLVLDGCKRVGGSVAALAKLEHLVELRRPAAVTIFERFRPGKRRKMTRSVGGAAPRRHGGARRRQGAAGPREPRAPVAAVLQPARRPRGFREPPRPRDAVPLARAGGPRRRRRVRATAAPAAREPLLLPRSERLRGRVPPVRGPRLPQRPADKPRRRPALLPRAAARGDALRPRAEPDATAGRAAARRRRRRRRRRAAPGGAGEARAPVAARREDAGPRAEAEARRAAEVSFKVYFSSLKQVLKLPGSISSPRCHYCCRREHTSKERTER